MRLVKIGLANINTTVGAFTPNTDRAISFAEEMAAAGCQLGAFQEQVISGYPAEDLVQWDAFVNRQKEALERFAAETGKCDTVFTLGVTAECGGNLYNCAAVVCRGKIIGLVPKEKLPTYNVFYESRTFSRGVPGKITEAWPGVPLGDMIFAFDFGTIGVEVCEDIWSPDGPMRRRAYSGAEIIVNASASPFRAGVLATRREMISTRAADNQTTVVYVNQYGGNDSLVFDGGGFVNQNGRTLLEAPRWREGLTTQVVDLDRTTRLRHENTTWRSDCERFLSDEKPVRSVSLRRGGGGPKANNDLPYPSPAHKSFFMPAHDDGVYCPREEFFNDIVEAMICGLDVFAKGRFRKFGIALSGGKDSVLTLMIAWIYGRRRFNGLEEDVQAAAMRDFIRCFSMPTRYNSDTTRAISRRICEELGVSFKETSIEQEFALAVRAQEEMLDGPPSRIALQNIQARIRGERMWNWANTTGGFWLQTSNMSEKAVGYTTIGGDMMGAYSLIANLPKTVVTELLKHLHAKYGVAALADVIATKASAELADNQEDEKDLMPFPVLDACLALFAGEKLEVGEVKKAVREMWSDAELAAMHPAFEPQMLDAWVEKFAQLFVGSIFKWVQAPEAVHLGSLDLDRERALQLPVVQSREWLGLQPRPDIATVQKTKTHFA